MTTDQKNKYEESIARQSYKSHPLGDKDSIGLDECLELVEDAHSEGQKDGWNEAIDNIERKLTGMMSGVSNDTYDKTIWLVIEEIQKLRK